MKTKSCFLVLLFVVLIVTPGCGPSGEKPAQKRESKSLESEAIIRMRYFTAMQDLKSIGSAIEAYMVDNYDAPNAANLTELQAQLVPNYIRLLPTEDPWGNGYIYTYLGKGEYAAASAGSDGKFDGFQQTGRYTGFKNNDIIYSNGQYSYVAQQ